MKHSNLTYREKILRWFDAHPSTINSLCESNQHILDWIYGGYRGKLSAKIDLTIKLVNRGADLAYVSPETFKTILYTFIAPNDSQQEHAVFVLKNILKRKEKLKESKKDLPYFNSLILADSIWEAPNNELKNEILYSDISGETHPFLKDVAHKINYNSHPVIFLLQHYFLFINEIKSGNTHSFLKLDKIHELNDDINFTKMSFQYHESYSYIPNQMISASIGVQDTVLNVLEKIKTIKQNSRTNINSSNVSKNIEIIDAIIKRDLCRNLNHDLPDKPNTSKRIKI